MCQFFCGKKNATEILPQILCQLFGIKKYATKLRLEKYLD